MNAPRSTSLAELGGLIKANAEHFHDPDGESFRSGGISSAGTTGCHGRVGDKPGSNCRPSDVGLFAGGSRWSRQAAERKAGSGHNPPWVCPKRPPISNSLAT